ncbi:MAG: glycosyltransferase [Spirochaetia bacterium]|nr:glycosyltransferase [Spirochaetia bacterium]
MKVSCYTFIRNGEVLGYPFIESIKSALPICDEFVIAAGKGDDHTRKMIEKIGNKKIRIIDTIWNEGQKTGGFVYAQQKMIAQYNCTGDWAFYLEGDEVLHEKDLDTIYNAMKENLNDERVEALAFHYHHFYGNPQTIINSPAWCRSGVRIIKNNLRAIAMDGLHFTVMINHKNGRWPRGKKINAAIYHYGYVRSILKLQEKLNKVSKYWGTKVDHHSYGDIDPEVLHPFSGTHPAIMKKWLQKDAQKEFTLNPDYKITKREKRHRFYLKLEKWFNLDLNKKHYKTVK